MQYLGGKSQFARQLCAILEDARQPGQRFVDVFTGGANIVAGMGDHGPRVANDGCKPLITLYRAWLDGWRPPAEVSEQLYHEIKTRKDLEDPLTAFVGFGCTFGAKWFGGYARGWVKPGTLIHASPAKGGTEPANFAATAARGLTKRLALCSDVSFVCSDFADLEILPGDLIYADPEYRGTTRYGYFKTPFPHDRFVTAAQGWAEIPGVKVFVSEYASQAPTWEQVFERTSKKGVAGAARTERVFRVRPITATPV